MTSCLDEKNEGVTIFFIKDVMSVFFPGKQDLE